MVNGFRLGWRLVIGGFPMRTRMIGSPCPRLRKSGRFVGQWSRTARSAARRPLAPKARLDLIQGNSAVAGVGSHGGRITRGSARVGTRGRLTVGRVSQGVDFDFKRMRNTYWLERSRLGSSRRDAMAPCSSKGGCIGSPLDAGLSSLCGILAIVTTTRHTLNGPRPLATNSGRGSA